MRYIRPTSLTWWAGLLAVATGTANMALPDTGPLAEIARLVTLLSGSGDASPAALIAIGLRDRLERGFRGDA